MAFALEAAFLAPFDAAAFGGILKKLANEKLQANFTLYMRSTGHVGDRNKTFRAQSLQLLMNMQRGRCQNEAS